jgi:mannosyltransferase
MRNIFRRTHVYLTASLEEGFGLPMLEALTAGCQVVAIRQPLTVEIMSDAIVLIDDGNTTSIGRQLQDPPWVPSEDRRRRASMFSWVKVIDIVAAKIESLTH